MPTADEIRELDARWRATNQNQVNIINRLLNGATYEDVLQGLTARIAVLEAELEHERAELEHERG